MQRGGDRGQSEREDAITRARSSDMTGLDWTGGGGREHSSRELRREQGAGSSVQAPQLHSGGAGLT